MNSNSPNLDSLIRLLHSWTPLSPTFELAVRQHMEFQAVTPKKELNSLLVNMKYAWYSIDCWIAAYHMLTSDKEEVHAIHAPDQIFTDIKSFLTASNSSYTFRIISGSALLRIERPDFVQLRSFEETAVLLEHYLLQQSEQDHWRMELLRYSDLEKVAHFAKDYPINSLPGKVCASFLRMTPSRFSAARAHYNRNS